MVEPTIAQVRDEVFKILSAFTTLSPNQIKGEYVLKSPPLLLDDIGLGFLAISLRGYVKQYVSGATVKAKELRKSGLTVNSVISIIQKKVGLK